MYTDVSNQTETTKAFLSKTEESSTVTSGQYVGWIETNVRVRSRYTMHEEVHREVDREVQNTASATDHGSWIMCTRSLPSETEVIRNVEQLLTASSADKHTHKQRHFQTHPMQHSNEDNILS